MKLKAKNIEGEIIEFEVINNKVHCSDKKLTEILYIPDIVKILYCSFNKLTSLPPLNNITILDCSYNQLLSLPDLPNIKTLFCDNNQLTSLPNLYNMEYLYCDNNKFGKVIGIKNYKDVVNVKTNIDIDNIQILEL